MIDILIEKLKKSDADAWEITDSRIEGWQFYFIKHRLDQNRAKDVEHIRVNVYKRSEDGESLGTAGADISPTESDEGLDRIIKNLIFQAGLVKNKYYELNRPSDGGTITLPDFNVYDESEKYINAMKDVPETDSEYINSYEIFTDSVRRRFINSNGIDIEEVYPVSMVEVVVNAKDDEHEIELYRLYNLGTCNRDNLIRDISETMRYGSDRLNTQKTPALKGVPVIFSTDASVNIYSYFLYNLNASYVYRKISSFELEKNIAEDAKGDRVTVETSIVMDGSSENFSYDAEGARIRDMVLMDGFVPVHYWGSRMFSQYMGLDDSFIVSNWTAKGGTKTIDEIRSGDYLEVVEFSDFQVDEMTGDIFGEIRLAYWHHDGVTTPVSGGSVSGNMRDNLGDMEMSKELRQYNSVKVPYLTKLKNITIASSEN